MSKLAQTLFVDLPARVMQELLPGPLAVQLFLGLGWLCALVMLTSILASL